VPDIVGVGLGEVAGDVEVCDGGPLLSGLHKGNGMAPLLLL
jgi:hypothetical protein